MYIFSLLDASFDVGNDNRIIVFGLTNILEYAAMTNFASGDFDTTQVDYNLTQ